MIKDNFNDWKSAYYTEIEYLYNRHGDLYEKADPRRQANNNLQERWWYENDEENPHLKHDY